MKRTFNQTLAAYKKDTAGNMGMMLAVSTAALIGFLAVAVDLTNAFSAKQRLQDTTDAVALLAAQDKSLDTPAKLQEAAQALYDATYTGDTGFRIEIEEIIRVGDDVTVVAKNNIDANFAQIFNIGNLDVGVRSTASYSELSLDVALVLDSTGSMRETINGSRGQTKLAGLQDAANNLIDIFDNTDNDNIRLSVVPFSQYMNVGETNSRAGWLDLNPAQEANWEGCVGSRLNGQDESPNEAGGLIPALTTVDCASEILPLTNNMRRARTSVNNFEARGWTYIPSGIVWGWRTLEGQLPKRVPAAPSSTSEHRKVMVIMTDGENTRSKSGLTHEGQNIQAANSKTADLCADVKRDDIEVYTIAYGLSDNTTLNLLQDCASDSSKFFNAQTNTALSSAFAQIGSELTVLRITS